MKRLLFVALMPLLALSLSAQKWTVSNEKADDGEHYYISYEYVTPSGMVTIYEGDLSLLMFDRFDGPLADERNTILHFGKRGYTVKAVLFDKQENPKATLDLWLWKLDDLKAGGETTSQKNSVRRIINHLRYNEGPVMLYFPKTDYAFLLNPMMP